MAAPTATQFKAYFPEFGSLTDGQVDLAITAATTELDPEAFDSLYYYAVMYKAGDILCRSPYGMQNQLVNEDGETVYGQYFNNEIQYKCARRGLLTGYDLG